MLCVCIGDVVDVVFSVLYCEAWRAVGARVWGV